MQMSTAGNPNPWAPYEAYKDCSLQLCSMYCPQWCSIISPPPPPADDDDSSTDFSPLIIAVIGILASVFLLLSYYTIISKYCRRRNRHDSGTELEENHAQISNESLQDSNPGLNESLIKSIAVRKYKNGDRLVDGRDCSVCLSEFQEGENIRLLPKCNHAFHLPCIDPWLKSHSSCPLCRSSIGSTNPAPNPQQNVNILALEHGYRNESVLVIGDLERGFRIEEDVVPIPRSISVEDSSDRDRVSSSGYITRRR